MRKKREEKEEEGENEEEEEINEDRLRGEMLREMVRYRHLLTQLPLPLLSLFFRFILSLSK